MTVNSEMVLNLLKKNFGKEYSKQEIAAELGIPLSAVTGSINNLIKRKYAITTRVEEVEETPATETRKAKIRKVPYHTLTEEGLAYDPVAEEAQKAAEKLAEKERKAAERAAKKKAATTTATDEF